MNTRVRCYALLAMLAASFYLIAGTAESAIAMWATILLLHIVWAEERLRATAQEIVHRIYDRAPRKQAPRV